VTLAHDDSLKNPPNLISETVANASPVKFEAREQETFLVTQLARTDNDIFLI
jgi:hypothetical protein